MKFNSEKDIKINVGEIVVDGLKIADYIIYKADYNKDSKFSNIDIIPNIETEFKKNIGNNLNHSFSDYKTLDILMGLNNDFTALKDVHKDIYNSCKAINNYISLSDKSIKKIIEILNFTLEDEELGIYNDFSQYYFDLNTFNNCVLWCLKSCPLFIDMEQEEMIKEVIHYYIKVWLKSRYSITDFNSVEY